MEKTVIETTSTKSLLENDEKAVEMATRIALMVNTINGKVEGRTVKALTAGLNTIQVSFDTVTGKDE